MRKLFNWLLYPTGYRIERYSRFQRELDLLRRRPAGFRFVQIGANDGVRFDGLYAVVTNCPCTGIVVEPLADMFERLRRNYADYPRIVPIRKAVHATERVLPLFRVEPTAMQRYDGWASGIASFDRDHLLRHGVAAQDIAIENVECTPLMTLLEDTAMLEADLLHLDTEGYDAAILRMIDFGRFRPRLIKFEHNTMTRIERGELARTLAAHGYRTVREGIDTVAWRR